MTPVDISEQWQEDWSPASMLNSVLITNPAIWQSGFDLPRRSPSLLNHFRTGQGRCLYNLQKSGLASSDLYVCGQKQTMNHIVNECPSTKFGGRLQSLHEAGDDAIHWLEFSAATARLANDMKYGDRPTYTSHRRLHLSTWWIQSTNIDNIRQKDVNIKTK